MADKVVSILIVLAVLLIIGNLYCVGMDIKDIYDSDDVVEMHITEHITDDTAADDIIYYESDDIVGKEYMVRWQVW